MSTEVNRFKWARENIKKETMAKAAEGSGLAKSLLIDLESSVGVPRDTGYRKIMKLAEYYNVSMDWLCGILPFDNWHIEKDARAAVEYTGLSSEAIQILSNINESIQQARPQKAPYTAAFARQAAYNFFITDSLAGFIIEELYRYLLSDFSMAYRKPSKDEAKDDCLEKTTKIIRVFPSKEIRFLSLPKAMDSTAGRLDLALSEKEYSEIMLIRITEAIRKLRKQVQASNKEQR